MGLGCCRGQRSHPRGELITENPDRRLGGGRRTRAIRSGHGVVSSWVTISARRPGPIHCPITVGPSALTPRRHDRYVRKRDSRNCCAAGSQALGRN